MLVINRNTGSPQLTTVTSDEMLKHASNIIEQQAKNESMKNTVLAEVANRSSSKFDNKFDEFENRMGIINQHLKTDLKGEAHLDYLEGRDRFTDMLSNKSTNIDPLLNANQITVARKKVGIATQFPLKESIGIQLREMLERKSPALGVLTNTKEMNKSALSEKSLEWYFRDNISVNGIKSESIKSGVVHLGEMVNKKGKLVSIDAQLYKMTITDTTTKKSHTVDVMHVINWPDKTEVSVEIMDKMGGLMNSFAEKSGLDSGNSFVHCRAGVGRTLQLMAGMLTGPGGTLPAHVSAEEMLADFRFSRNGYMGQTEDQRRMLVDSFEQKGRPILREDPVKELDEDIYEELEIYQELDIYETNDGYDEKNNSNHNIYV